ncbi:uncharacterized protein BYT42DRAFT_594070 [Radiomyces spectabilis]|uniref:uncharacterized protein n=1 Tax=Radiomyces spectabilis TaxID=64574 RepID=UPI00221FE8C7|nr:uncharacterized protein BYT42DRAFT_594070 [Radiomyces spectabilis]KAI8375931.1 hypothetical protein BYT42DRAFT_594070 [Radiomyces spectabilis]
MKALATQRLIEQVSSLEKNVNNMGIHSLKPSKEAPPDVYTVVIDVTAFLDGLNKIKKWANQTVNPNMRHQQSILEVIVPLETIDLLDDHKKGTSHMNVQARESIRYLDQKLLKSQSDQRNLDAPTESYLRTQKVTEKLSDWGKAAAYWIGEETRSNIVDRLLCEMSEDEDTVNPFASDDSDAASTSSVELPMSRRRRHYEEDASEDEMDGSDNDDRVIYEESMTEESENQRESDDDASDSDVNEEDEDEEDEEQDEEESVTFNDVPQAYRPIINCMLFYHENQQKESKPPVDKQAAQVEKLVLVTNDEDLAWWAEMFGDPKNKQRLHVKTVNEWDRIISTLNFEKAFEHSSRRR